MLAKNRNFGQKLKLWAKMPITVCSFSTISNQSCELQYAPKSGPSRSEMNLMGSK